MTLEIIKKSRLLPKVGDIFTMKPRGGPYVFGRVVSIKANAGGIKNSILIYIYKKTGQDMLTIPDKLSHKKLLTPPLMTSRQPWTTGRFRTIENRPIGEDEQFAVHCFRDPGNKKSFLDEKGRVLDGQTHPCNLYGLYGYLLVENIVCERLHLSRG